MFILVYNSENRPSFFFFAVENDDNKIYKTIEIAFLTQNSCLTWKLCNKLGSVGFLYCPNLCSEEKLTSKLKDMK